MDFFHDLRYTQPPTDLWDWFEPFLDDEEVCQRAGSAFLRHSALDLLFVGFNVLRISVDLFLQSYFWYYYLLLRFDDFPC